MAQPPKPTPEPAPDSIAAIGEFGLIKRLARIIGPATAGIGIGDDCAVISAADLFDTGDDGGRPRGAALNSSLLISTDTMLEGRHYRTDLSSPFDVGYKLLMVNASDVAAMGGIPRAAVVAAQLRPDLPLAWIEEVYRGLSEAAKETGAEIVGGNVTRAEEDNSLAMTIIGVVSGPPVLRSGANPEDDLWVSGTPGLAQLGLDILLEKMGKIEIDEKVAEQAVLRHRRPSARIELGRMLQSSGLISAMVDVSDGLIQDLEHITEASGVSAAIEIASLPIYSLLPAITAPSRPSTISRPSTQAGEVLAKCALTGGDDYELLFTAPHVNRDEIIALAAVGGQKVTRIGRIETERTPPIDLLFPGGLTVPSERWCRETGYKHF